MLFTLWEHVDFYVFVYKMDKKRCNNYTHNEIEVLVDYVEKFKDIVGKFQISFAAFA